VLKAPAKVNLHLEILGRRGDGFHEILSLFQAVSLFDRIALRSLKVTGQVRVACTAPIPAERNIVTAALRAFRAKTGIEEGIDLRVWKSIPIGAGLGGGSSDAAATLRGLNGMFGRPLDGGLLAELAAGLGSDVPFFLEGGTALVGGRGERVTRVAGRGDYRIVLVWPGFGVDTREAYGWYDQAGHRRAALGPAEVRQRFVGLPPSQWGYFNSFQEVVEGRHPVLTEIAGDLRRAGAAAAGISGCGSTVFGVFASARQARAAVRRARRRFALAQVVSPLQIRGAQD